MIDEIDYCVKHTPIIKNIIKLAEESAELAAICAKAVFTGNPNFEAIAGEIVDVEICIEILKRQIPYIMDMHEIICKEKLNRMEVKRLNANKSNGQKTYVVSPSFTKFETKGFSFSTSGRNDP